MFLLDTDTLTRLHGGSSLVAARIRQSAPSAIATTIVSKVELLRGRISFLLKAENGAQLLRAQDWLTKTESLLAGIEIIPFDAAAAAEFDRLRNTRSLRKIGRADLLIASIGLSRRAVIVTRNQKHFRQVPQLKLENWVD